MTILFSADIFYGRAHNAKLNFLFQIFHCQRLLEQVCVQRLCIHSLSGDCCFRFSKLVLLRLFVRADFQIVSRLLALCKCVASFAFSCRFIACCMCYRFCVKCCTRSAIFIIACGLAFRLLWVRIRSARGSALLGASLDRARLVGLSVYASHQSTLRAFASQHSLIVLASRLC